MDDGVQDIGYGRAFAGFYDRIFPKDAYADLAAQQLADRHPGGGRRTLELGVGTGRIAIPLAERVGPVVGVDSSPEMLEELRRDTKEKNAAVTPVHGDIRQWGDDRSYGLVYCVCATLSMILTPEEQQEVIRRAAERLEPGGRLVVETWNRSGVLELFEGKDRTSYFVPYPEPGTGLLTHGTLIREKWLWQASHIWFEGGTSQVGTEVARLTTPEEVDGFATEAGLTPVERLSDWTGKPYEETAALFVATYAREE
ncbi:class I SAM-dependent methyltransferase [Streptomyces sp. JJ36]|uniref:class I SAM-dependent DNA methyltransferase n=1 Tax=Streptomyces sp. JJ36 TaxID=2736645 RepID=UPI001F1CF37B|nr:class I SAM-dependent methyltransferase [Streptomyces sp. JJ36]MCF6525232.1 class I SAM-dependent methyltransferase [Streptomyces sp. JJ36]